ncbi:hypothetical protein FQN57_003199 [Myotisia sp. PD_48]|nr:hypothetical protein FQN57_003199 [Myotisia sp. PD_48]
MDHLVQQCPESHQDAQFNGSQKPHHRPPKRQKTYGGPGSQYHGEPSQGKHRGHPRRSFPDPGRPRQFDYPPPPMPGYEGPPYPSEYEEHGQWQYSPPPQAYEYPHYDQPPPMDGYDHRYGPPPMYNRMHAPPGPYPRRQSGGRGRGGYHEHPSDRPPPSSWEETRRRPWGKGNRRDNHPYPPSRRFEPWTEESRGRYHPESKESRDAQSQIAWKPPHPVARPLPSIFSELDDISKLPPLSSLPRNMSVSKYFLDKHSDEFEENIRNTEDWPFMMGDPIFEDLPSDGELVPVSELIARQQQLSETHKVQPRNLAVEPSVVRETEKVEAREEVEQEDGEESEEGEEGYTRLEEGGHPEDNSRSPQSPSSRSYRSYPLSRGSRSGSEPAHASDEEQERDEDMDEASDVERDEVPIDGDHPSDIKTEANYDDYEVPIDGVHPSGYKTGANYGDYEVPIDDFHPSDYKNEANYGAYNANERPPPPPPPPHRESNYLPKGKKFNPRHNRDQNQYPTGKNRRSSNFYRGKKEHFASESSQRNGSNFRQPYYSNEQVSPTGFNRSSRKEGDFNDEAPPETRPTDDSDTVNSQKTPHGSNQTSPTGDNNASPDQGHSGGRQRRSKRAREDDSPVDFDTEPQRQEDDVTPKLKRRQPHVAAAYR